ncbi:iron complex outermembrane recepter protein [Arboricoccus pini]|uniref:Iron complex outermembrane recepter protein n=1 Tax=Arboricoccus pini TaxID=1963835 RepID=A0A212RK32_9PROT|nr:TonB-dependent siderophore receptor [Arboricoccus pini]SNB72812.1 iron complex outermembrane recepter protein [Arboricoccus pini]
MARDVLRKGAWGIALPVSVLFGALDDAGAQEAGVSALGEIKVEGQSVAGEDGGKGPVDGFVAKTSTAGSKTDTPIIETPQAITVIGRDRMETLQATSTNEAIRYAPGIAVDVYGPDTRSDNYLTIRGLPGNFYQDGLRLPVTRPYASYRVDPWMLDRIEILRGPASILYGQGGPGGTINYVSKRPEDTPHTIIEQQFGNRRRLETAIDQNGLIDKAGKWSYRINALGSRSDLGGGDPYTGQRVAVAPSLSFKPNDQTSLTAFASYLHDDTSISSNFLPARGTVLPNPNGRISRNQWTGDRDYDEYKKEQWSLGYEFEHHFNSMFTIRQNLRYSSVDSDIKTVYGADLLPSSYDRTLSYLNRYAVGGNVKSKALTIDNQLETKLDTGPARHTFLLGVDFLREKSSDHQDFRYGDPLNLYTGQSIAYPLKNPTLGIRGEDQTVTQTGVYVQDQVKLWEKLVITGGIRFDAATNDYKDVTDASLPGDRAAINKAKARDHDWSPRIGAVYLFDNGLAPYASYTESFSMNAGSEYDLSTRKTNGDPFAPSSGKQREVGLRWQPPGTRHSFTASYFDLDQTNVVSGSARTAYAEDLRSRGFELEALMQFDLGVRVIASYTHQNVKVSDSESRPQDVGNHPTAVPSDMAQLWSDYTFQDGLLKGFRFGGGVRWTGSTNGGTDSTSGEKVKVPDFALFDAGISYDIKNWRFALNASNLTDKTYVSGCGDPTSCFYGPGRLILGSVRYSF